MNKTNEELAVLIYNGAGEYTKELWSSIYADVRHCVKKFYNRFLRVYQKNCRDPDDMIQDSFLYMLRAVGYYGKSAGKKPFMKYFYVIFRSEEFRILKKTKNILYLDEPIYEDNPLYDVVENADANGDMERIVESEYDKQVVKMLNSELPQRLSESEIIMLGEIFCGRKTLEEIAAASHCSAQNIQYRYENALLKLYRSRNIKKFYKETRR